MAASRMCQGVTKSGSPTPREITPFWLWTMSKNSRMPERGIWRTTFATNDSGLNFAAMCMRGEPRGVPRGSQSLSGGLVLAAANKGLRLVEDNGTRDLHSNDVIGARDLIHYVEHDFLQNPAKGARAGSLADRNGGKLD